MWIKHPIIAVAIAVASAGMGTAQAPLSAIDWLSNSVATPAPVTPADPSAEPATQDPVGPVTPDTPITITALTGPNLDAAGLLSPAITGLPATLWGPSDIDELVRLVRTERINTLPAIQSLLYTILLAELTPPVGSNGQDGTLLLARLDKLLELGALEQAQALVERAGPTANAELFRRWFDISLLTGHEDRACQAMRATPDIAPTFPARIFCLARGGDWNAAALTLETGRALGYVDEAMDALLLKFLEPDFAETADVLPPPRPSPLVFRIMEAIGEPMASASMPLAFAQTDLRSNGGWKTRIEAAERLSRSGAISANRLLGVYTERLPAASGGIWDRVDALQAFDVAILASNPTAVSATLPPAWAAMRAAGLEVHFAELYGERLAKLPLSGDAVAIAFRVGLLSRRYEAIAIDHKPADATEAFLSALARGQLQTAAPVGDRQTAVRDAFTTAEIGPAMQARLDEGRLGEALLEAINLVTEGARGELSDVIEGLALLHKVGLESVARRAALEFLLLERRG